MAAAREAGASCNPRGSWQKMWSLLPGTVRDLHAENPQLSPASAEKPFFGRSAATVGEPRSSPDILELSGSWKATDALARCLALQGGRGRGRNTTVICVWLAEGHLAWIRAFSSHPTRLAKKHLSSKCSCYPRRALVSPVSHRSSSSGRDRTHCPLCLEAASRHPSWGLLTSEHSPLALRRGKGLPRALHHKSSGIRTLFRTDMFN
ncbi:uncharacterized protein LOC112542860 [Python bivittatus]|uniref:Uncharacterized protein LOC112542860 n=1 Tax=Python bivittatus TaxID=176946 RepID=A0A9F5JF82_PYTBI|nr:uncharacterized protein LOC112542860 [Python bivittatus]